MTSRTLRLSYRLRRIAASPSSLRIGLVGWEGSGTDSSIFQWVEAYLTSLKDRTYGDFDQERHWGTARDYDEEIANQWENADKDVININEGRDFLSEQETYDIVILCWIFGKALPFSVGAYKVSEQHTPEAWRSRLASSGAKYIFAFGNKTEVGGAYLGEIPGYQKKTLSPSATVYDHK